MSELCTIQPISAFMSTNLSSKIQCYQELGARIMRNLGHPIINVEIHPDQLYDAISQACEFFTKYAGYTREYIIFDSNIYEKNKGVRLDHLFTVAKTGFTLKEKLEATSISNPDFEVSIRENLYIATSAIPYTYFSSSSALSASIPTDGITEMQVLDSTSYASLTTFSPDLSGYFAVSEKKPLTMRCEPTTANTFNNMFDYDVMEYRKVIDVIEFYEGTSSGISTLFSLEQTLAQQTYYSYAMGNFGFDLLSWQTVKLWQDTREKLLAINRDVQFDNRTQYMRMIPEPKDMRFFGILQCYVERPLRDVIKERWVLDYATALAKIMWGRILTKINGVNMLGGGTLNGGEVLQEGVSEKKELETMLVEGGYGDFEPPMFYIN